LSSKLHNCLGSEGRHEGGGPYFAALSTGGHQAVGGVSKYPSWVEVSVRVKGWKTSRNVAVPVRECDNIKNQNIIKNYGKGIDDYQECPRKGAMGP